MRVFKTRWFNRWASKEKLNDRALIKAIEEMEAGLVDADLGGNVYKKRVALPGRGKSGSVRTIVAYRIEDKAFYMYGFAKKKRANIDDEELKVFRVVAKELLGHDDKKLDHLINKEELFEVLSDE
ncbi:MAG: type II toxin-antitoxin system RelE/ParE family toxin [Pseudomonadales bacterium]|nr:type II toxin-antitoxin system RelE/ParE family toxin [Pseudomonadales bacterium]